MKYNHYQDDPSLFTGDEELDDSLEDLYSLLAGMAEEIVIRTDADVKVDYKQESLTVQMKEDALTKEAKDFIEEYRKAMPAISIFFENAVAKN